MQTFLIILCLALMILAATAVMMFRSLIKSTIFLAVASVLLAIVMFLLGAYWAALFELSVCAGLITAVFISAISFFTTARRSADQAQNHRSRFKPLPYLLIISGLGLLALLALNNFSLNVHLPALSLSSNLFEDFKNILWQTRQADILAQIALILAGSFAVIVLFKEKDEDKSEKEGEA
ncbi:MAG: hypothetical protein FWG43_02455 [Clostridiales bacterium]|nr:hypothetical protein [Clostridiales bacterium]